MKQILPSNSKLAIFCKTSMRNEMRSIGVDQRYFYEEITLKCITDHRQLIIIANDAFNVEIDLSGEDEREIGNYLKSHIIPIKRVIQCIDKMVSIVQINQRTYQI